LRWGARGRIAKAEAEEVGMPDDTIQTEIKNTDIVFDCPHCTKSLAIDRHGAGLFIVCPDCANRVQVPVPEGMDVTELEGTEEEKAVRMALLRESLSSAQDRISELEAEVADLQERRDDLERLRTAMIQQFRDIAGEVETVEAALARVTETLQAAEPQDED
jgi:predicted  nucleic acid-binding Zn-ribbon protein